MKSDSKKNDSAIEIFRSDLHGPSIVKIIMIIVCFVVLSFQYSCKTNSKVENIQVKQEFQTEFRFKNYYDEEGSRKPDPEPQHIYGPIYHIGPLTVCAYLVKTDQGLILFDSGYDIDGELIPNNIRKLGMDPRDIKKIFITHWHNDHSGGAPRLSNLSGAEIMIHTKDIEIVRNKVYTKEYMVPAIEKIRKLEGNETFNFGNVVVQVIHAPGQTPGEVVYLLRVNGPQGKCIALVAGDATAMKSTVEEFEPNKFHGIVNAYEKTVDILNSLVFDLYLGGHPHQVFKEMREDGNPFVSRDEWLNMVANRNQQKIDFLKEHPEYIDY